jgi:hypothetical protein
MLSVMQISRDEDSCDYSFDEFSSQCDQLASIHEELESNATRKCSKSRDSEILGEYSVDDNFDSPKKETFEVYASSQDRDQLTDKVEHATPPVPDNATPSRGDPSEGHSQSHVLAEKEEHEDEYIGDIDATPLDANNSLVCESNVQEKKSEQLPSTDARTQSNVSSHHYHMPTAKRTAFVPRCAYAETKSMKCKKTGDMQIAEPKSAKVSCYSLERLTQLSKPVEHRSYHSDNEHGYKMKIKPQKTSLDSSESRSSFLERMESKEEERKEKLSLAIARAGYDANVDKVSSCAILDLPFRICPHSLLVVSFREKNVCPNCRQTQSFQEMTKGKMECSNDGCRNEKHRYGPPTQFKIRGFEERMKSSAQRRSLIFNSIEEERKSKILSTCQKTSRRQQELRDRASVEDFDTRMANDIREREEKITTLEQTAMAMIGIENNFKPKLHVVESLIKHRQGGLERLSQPSRRYTEEYQPPDDEIEQMKKKYQRMKKPLESPTQTKQSTKKLDNDKLKKSFKKMNM